MGEIKALLTAFVHPGDVDHALYLIGKTLTRGGTMYTVQTGEEERLTLGMAPFTVSQRQKQLVFALESPISPYQMRDVAQEAITGLIYGLTVRGEIRLSEDTTINNLAGLGGWCNKEAFIKDIELIKPQQ